jgi:hypothetical protein
MATRSLLEDNKQVQRAIALIGHGRAAAAAAVRNQPAVRTPAASCTRKLPASRPRKASCRSPPTGSWLAAEHPCFAVLQHVRVHAEGQRARRDRGHHEGVSSCTLPRSTTNNGRTAPLDHPGLAPGEVHRLGHAVSDEVHPLQGGHFVNHAYELTEFLRLRSVRTAGARRQGTPRRADPLIGPARRTQGLHERPDAGPVNGGKGGGDPAFFFDRLETRARSGSR